MSKNNSDIKNSERNALLAGHHEQKNKKTTGQVKFSAVTIRQ